MIGSRLFLDGRRLLVPSSVLFSPCRRRSRSEKLSSAVLTVIGGMPSTPSQPHWSKNVSEPTQYSQLANGSKQA